MAFAARLALLCALVYSTLAAAPGPTGLYQLLGRMRAVNGGLPHAHIVSTSRHMIDGIPSVLTTHAQGLRYRQDQCTGSVCLGTYFDGERLFSVNINDTALPRSAYPEAHVRALRILGTLSFLDPHFAGFISDGGMLPFRGHLTHRIFVSDHIAAPMIVYVDPKTGLVAGAQDLNGDTTYVMHDYRRTAAFMLPFRIDLNGAPLEIYLTRQIVHDEFPAPKGLHATADQGLAPMALDPQSVSPLGSCTLNGRSTACLIDSGNSAMAMSVELADALNLKPIGMLRVAGLGNYATEVVRAGPLRMGGVEFDAANYIVLSDIHRYGYDLVVGADVLAGMPVTLDYKHHQLYFGQKNPRRDAITVPLAFENFVPVVNVTLGDESSALAVDTGDQSNINLGYEYYRRHEGLFVATKTQNVSGIGGQSVEMIGEIGSVQIGTLTAEHQQIGTTKTLHGTADGHLGAGFLSNYRVVLDYIHQTMRLEPTVVH